MKRKLIICFIALSGIVNAQYRTLHIFNDTNGKNPCGSLTMVGSKLYGMTQNGGAYKYGCIFSLDTNGSDYKDLFDFDVTNGANPWYTQLTYSRNKLYGMTENGGAYNNGCIFSMDTNGHNFKDIFNFNGPMGGSPLGSLTLSGSKLYGMTFGGGTYGVGTIFSIDTNGRNYKKLFNFNNTNGSAPYGNLALSNDVLYGMTGEGGKYNIGTIFSIDTDGSRYKKLLDFDNTNGANPLGSLMLSGNTLYGMTNREGGHNDYGCLFSIDTNGNNYKNLLNFNGGTEGMFPFGSVILSGNSLYGMTAGGGSNIAGTIFSIDTNGNTFNNLFVLDSTDGSFPSGSLILSGNILYGVTSEGSLNNNGVIFAFRDTNGGLGVNEVKGESEKINVYPNPSNGIFTLSHSHPELVSGTQIIEIYNTMGAKVYNATLKQVQGDNTIDLSNQPNGVYLYRVISENGELIGEGKIIVGR